MKILAIGDIFGRPGRAAVAGLLPEVVKEHKIDFVMANAENASGGRGLTKKVADELFNSPIDVFTAGNHIWEHDEILPYLDSHPILRPVNVIENKPGRGWLSKKIRETNIAVVSLQGQLYMDDKGPKVSNPFHYIEALLPDLRQASDLIIIDFHAETTSEKRAVAWFLDGRVTAVLGTHTHVQTADEEILPRGTAYISDLGMTGPHASVIGLDKDVAITRFLTGDKKHFKVAENDVRLEGVIIEIDEMTRRTISIVRLQIPYLVIN